MSVDKTAVSTGDSLRLLADWYDQHPERTAPFLSVFIPEFGTKEETLKKLAEWAKALTPVQKQIDDWNINLTREFGSLTFRVTCTRSAICEKVVTYKCPESLLASLGQDVAEKLGG